MPVVSQRTFHVVIVPLLDLLLCSLICDSCSVFGLNMILFLSSETTLVQHGVDAAIQSCKSLLDHAILLQCVRSHILEFDFHCLLIAFFLNVSFFLLFLHHRYLTFFLFTFYKFLRNGVIFNADSLLG